MRKFGWFLKTIAVFTALVFFSMPLLAQQIEVQGTQQQQKTETGGDYMQGKIDGERDGRGNFAWYFGGLCLGLIGVILAFVIAPQPSTENLVGRSSEYIMGYTEGYKSKAKRQQGYYALGGLATLVVVYIVLVVIILTDEETYDYYY